MATHSPKFSFRTVNDLLDSDVSHSTEDTILHDNKKQVYHKVYLEFIERTEEIEKKDCSSLLTSGSGSCINKNDKTQPTSTKVECIWSDTELRILRKAFRRLKLHNIALVGKVNSLENELADCKNNQRISNLTLTSLKDKWSELKKRYRRIKISCKSMKEDLTAYHSALKSAGEEIKNLKDEKNVLLKHLKEVKMKLNMETISKNDLQAKLEGQESRNKEALEHCAFITRQQCKLDETMLKKEIFLLKEELRKEKQENNLNKNALESLRTHFVSMKVNDQNHLVADNILSATGINFT